MTTNPDHSQHAHPGQTDNVPRSLLKSYFLRNKWTYIVSTLCILLAQIVQVQFPNIIGRYTNQLSAGNATVQSTIHYALYLLLVGLGYVIFFGLGQYQNGRLGRQFEYEMRDTLFAHWETLSTAYFRRRSIGDLLNHAMNDVQAVREIMSMGLNQITTAVCLLAAALFMTLTTVSPRLTLVSIIPLFAVPVIILLIGPRIRVASRKVQEGPGRSVGHGGADRGEPDRYSSHQGDGKRRSGSGAISGAG